MEDLLTTIKFIINFKLPSAAEFLEDQELIKILDNFSKLAGAIQLENFSTKDLVELVTQLRNVIKLYKDNFSLFNNAINSCINDLISISFIELKPIIINFSESLENKLIPNQFEQKTKLLIDILHQAQELIPNENIAADQLLLELQNLLNRFTPDIFSLLPKDLKNTLFDNFLTAEDRKTFRGVNKKWLSQWEQWFTEKKSWQNRVEEEFPNDYKNVLDNQNYINANKDNLSRIYKNKEINWRKAYEIAFKRNYYDLPKDIILVLRLVKMGDLEKLKQEEIRYNYRDAKNLTLLDWASHKSQTAIQKYLYNKFVDTSPSPFIWSIECGQVKEGYINSISNMAPVLRAAVEYGQFEIVKDLVIKEKVNVNLLGADDNKTTALSEAAFKGYIDIVKFLLEQGAWVNGFDENSNQKNQNILTPLHFAIINNHFEIVHLLLEYKADVHYLCGKALKISMLEAAVKEGNLRIIEALLKRNVDVNACNKWGNSPLYNAVRFNYIAVVELLLKYQADIQIENGAGETVLHAAVCIEDQADSLDMIKLLISYKANINALDKRGISTLDVAVKLGYIEIVKILLANGAEIKSTNCIPSDKKEIAELLNFEVEFREMMTLMQKQFFNFSFFSNYLPILSGYETEKEYNTWQSINNKLQKVKCSQYFENRLIMLFENSRGWLFLDEKMFQRFCGALLGITEENSRLYSVVKEYIQENDIHESSAVYQV